ncbi:hypothetical protein AVEN_248638-1 [Araneus ventricosus]|uniref:EGF-like domain-containing protein n=1 Tax=Araneus ventricosus TaxID=182803 RepID=A0A4Y2C2Z7_ARAVE|nr:hypothetical protein AVEN_248638-1 [Araneus ventricosus]
MPPRSHHLGWLLGLAVLAITVCRPAHMQGLLSCSSNPCKNGASCVSNPRGESYCKHPEQLRHAKVKKRCSLVSASYCSASLRSSDVPGKKSSQRIVSHFHLAPVPYELAAASRGRRSQASPVLKDKPVQHEITES